MAEMAITAVARTGGSAPPPPAIITPVTRLAIQLGRRIRVVDSTSNQAWPDNARATSSVVVPRLMASEAAAAAALINYF